MKLFDVVELVEDIPGARLHKGAIGTIIDIPPGVPNPNIFEVEFCDKQGKTIEMLALRVEQIKLVIQN